MEQSESSAVFATAPHSPVRPALNREVLRQGIVNLIFIFAALLPVEGILRKWVLNFAEQPLAFIRDPVLALIYFNYLIYKGSGAARIAARWFLIFLVFLILGLIQGLLFEVPFPIILIGLRGYVGYIPLCFIIGDTMYLNEVLKLIRWTLLACIPIAILVYIQFHSPVASPINKGLTDDTIGRFIVTRGIVRPYGPFTFTQAQAVFSAFGVAALLIAWISDRARVPKMLLILGSISVMTMGALSGARTFFGSALVVLAFGLFTTFSSRSRSGPINLKAPLVVLAALLTFVLLFTNVFTQSFAAMSERQQDAARAQGSVQGRYFRSLTKVVEALQVAPALGNGIGLGSNAGAFIKTGSKDFALAEDEWPKVVLELGPLFGLGYLAFRVLFTAQLFLKALASARAGNAVPMILFGFCGILVFSSGYTLQNQMLSFTWLGVGLCLASMNTEARWPGPAAPR